MTPHHPQTCPRCQSPMDEGTLSTWHPDSFQPLEPPRGLWQRWFHRRPAGLRAWHCPVCGGFQVDRPPNPVAEELRRRRYITPCRWTIAAAWCACLAAYAFFLVDALTQTVILGLLSLALAISISILARLARYPDTATFLRLYVYLALSFLLYLAFIAAAPRRLILPASRLYAFVSGAYVAATGMLTYRAFNHPPRFKTTTRLCAGCGYLLYGLTEPRCPECGREFNPYLLEHAPAPRLHSPPRFR